MVGDGESGFKGPFIIAPQQSFQGQMIPICVGWFGDNNEDFEKTSRSWHEKRLKEKIAQVCHP
jgi:hypothetical protein